MDLATIQIKVDTREVKAANDDIGKLGRTGTQASKDVNAANDSMVKSTGRVSAAYKALGGVMAALGVSALVSSFANTVTATERLRASLVTVTGSTENAAFAFDQLLQFANTTPFTLDQSVQGFTKLVALGLNPSERALQSYGNTAAGMGYELSQMIEAVADASTFEFERLKQFGIRAKQQADTVSFTFAGVTTTVGKNSEEIQEYLLGIGETNFAGAMEDQMARLPGMLSMLTDNVTKFFLAIGEAGGINAFGAAISAASTAIVFATENLDILGTAFMAAAAAAGVAFGPTMALAALASLKTAIASIQTAVITLYGVIAAHPFLAIATALGAAAVIMIRHWDAIKKAAQSAAINIQIGWNKLMLFLMNAFAPALSSITDLFKDIQRQAIATWTAVKAATMDPLNAIETFNSTFDETLEALDQGDDSARVFGVQIRTTRNRIEELYGELETLNAETELADDNFVEAEQSLSDFQVQIDETAVAAAAAEVEMEAMRTKALEVLGAISNEQEALHLSNLELEIRNNLQKAGVDATSELGEQIIAATTELHNEKAALDAASTAADELAKANEEAQKKIAEDTKATKDAISGFFVDLFTNGKDAFKNIGDSFKAMLVKMLADWAASRVMEIISGGFSNLGSSISSMFSGILGSISSTISGLASRAAAVLGGGGGAAGTAAASVAAATSAAATTAAVTGGINTAALAAGSGLAAGTTAGFTAPGALAGTTAVTGLTGGTTAATTAAATGGGISSALQTLGPAALFAYLALKWDIFGLNRPNYPSFEELPPAVQAQELLEAFEANAQPFMMGLGPEDTEGMAGFEPAVLIDLYRRIKGRLGTDASDTLSKIENHPLLQTSLYDMIDGSFKDGLYNVPHDGFVAELHAGERVLTAQEANARDSMAMDIASLRGSIEEIMIAVARNTAKSYRLYDRWDKNGLPPTRA